MTEHDNVEHYLDALFDSLSGTGQMGRRALAEAEEHLADAVADAMARGVPRQQAEREAVARFGGTDTVGRRLRQTHRSPAALTLSDGWLLAGLAAALVALSFLSTAAGRALLLARHSAVVPLLPGGYHSTASTTYHQLGIGIGAGVLAAILLAARRHARPAPVSMHTPVVAAGVCVALASALFALPAPVRRIINVDAGSMPGLYYTVLAGTMFAVAAAGCVIWAVALRRGSHPSLAAAVE